MDSDFWTSHLAAAAAKRQFTLHHHQISQLDGLNIDDFEADDEVRPDFPCPYCYEDFDIASLCSHLEMTTRASPKSPFDPSLSYEEREERMRQAARRVFFLQDLLASSLLSE
ncbi:unnamed protein product [Camellia sinensis]